MCAVIIIVLCTVAAQYMTQSLKHKSENKIPIGSDKLCTVLKDVHHISRYISAQVLLVNDRAVPYLLFILSAADAVC